MSGHLTVPGRGFGSVDDSTAFAAFMKRGWRLVVVWPLAMRRS